MRCRYLVLLLILLLPSFAWADGEIMLNSYAFSTGGTSYATPAYVNSAYGMDGSGTSSTIATSSFSVSSGNTLIVGVCSSTSAARRVVSSISDTAGNTFTRCGSYYQPNNDLTIEIWAAHNITANASNVITATFDDAAYYRFIAAHQVSNLATSSAYDQQAYAYGTSTSISCGPTSTTSQTHEYIFAFAVIYGESSSGTPGTDYTERIDASQIYTEDRVVTSTGTYSAALTHSGGGDGYAVMMATFKAKAN